MKISLSSFRYHWLTVLILCLPLILTAQYHHQQDIIYGYKDGMALVMDVFSPEKNKNGACVIYVMSGGMRSSPYRSHYADNDPIIKGLIESGFVLCSVAHGSQPRYTVEDIRKDISRAVRYIRQNSDGFGIDSQRIGIMGRSSGAQLALMASFAPPPVHPDSWDSVEHESAELQAAVAYYPGVDLINFGEKGVTILEHFHSNGNWIDAAFDFHLWDTSTYRFERIDNPEIIREKYQQNSPLTWVSEDDPPVLIFHGDADNVVPIQQSESLVAKLEKVGITHKFIVAKDQGHGWDEPLENELSDILKWFSQHLLQSK